MTKEYDIVLAGQPNAGKSTLFNDLTGVRQFVANYPGVTVEKRGGVYKYDNTKFNVTDLPGTYSLTAYSIEERVARAIILEEKPDLTIHVVDASNLARNLYFTFQLIELDRPVLMALNMVDVAKARGVDINVEKLEQEMKIPVMPVIANKNKGIKELKERIFRSCETSRQTKVEPAKKEELESKMVIRYGDVMEEYLEKSEHEIMKIQELDILPARWLAIKWMENDTEVEKLIRGEKISNPILPGQFEGD